MQLQQFAISPQQRELVGDQKEQLRSLGYRITPQRELILTIIVAGGGHTTISELVEQVQLQASAVNRATVYRTVSLLCELGLLEAASHDGTTVYEVSGTQPHHHLVCRTCGVVALLDQDYFQFLVDTVADDFQFEVALSHMTLYGTCTACASQ